MTEDDRQITQEQAAQEAEHERSGARGAELREELAETDARRTEEQADKTQEEAEKARQEAEQLRERQRVEEERARAAAAQAERARGEAEHAAGMRDDAARAGAPAGALPPPHEPQGAMERPEVLVGAAFAGSFILARILKRIFD